MTYPTPTEVMTALHQNPDYLEFMTQRRESLARLLEVVALTQLKWLTGPLADVWMYGAPLRNMEVTERHRRGLLMYLSRYGLLDTEAVWSVFGPDAELEWETELRGEVRHLLELEMGCDDVDDFWDDLYPAVAVRLAEGYCADRLMFVPLGL